MKHSRWSSSLRVYEASPGVRGEIIFVDGGSRDGTIKLLREACEHDPIYRLISRGRPLPGQGRNIGVTTRILIGSLLLTPEPIRTGVAGAID